MLVHESPEKGIPQFLPGLFGFGIVRHFQDVVAPGEVGLADHESAIGELRHAVNIGNHDPIVGIDVEFHEPFVHFVGMNFAEQEEVSHNHESFNMVRITGFKEVFDDVINGFNSGGSVVKGSWNLALEVQEIGVSLFGTFSDVDHSHKFAPTNDLPDESFQCIHGKCIFGVEF